LWAACWAATSGRACRASVSCWRRDLVGQVPNASVEPVTDPAHGRDVLSGRVLELPVFVTLAREDRAGVTASHRDHDVGCFDELVGQWLGEGLAHVHSELAHHLQHGRIGPIARPNGSERERTASVAIVAIARLVTMSRASVPAEIADADPEEESLSAQSSRREPQEVVGARSVGCRGRHLAAVVLLEDDQVLDALPRCSHEFPNGFVEPSPFPVGALVSPLIPEGRSPVDDPRHVGNARPPEGHWLSNGLGAASYGRRRCEAYAETPMRPEAPAAIVGALAFAEGGRDERQRVSRHRGDRNE
jgi:hypothetical protein